MIDFGLEISVNKVIACLSDLLFNVVKVQCGEKKVAGSQWTSMAGL